MFEPTGFSFFNGPHVDKAVSQKSFERLRPFEEAALLILETIFLLFLNVESAAGERGRF